MSQTLISEEVAKTPPKPGAVGIYSVPLQHPEVPAGI